MRGAIVMRTRPRRAAGSALDLDLVQAVGPLPRTERALCHLPGVAEVIELTGTLEDASTPLLADPSAFIFLAGPLRFVVRLRT